MTDNEKMQAEIDELKEMLTIIVGALPKAGCKDIALSVDDSWRLRKIVKSWSEDKNN